MKITLCGSTRFKDEYRNANAHLTLAGHIVYSVAIWSHSDLREPTPNQKEHLDLIHLIKIMESDAIVVVGRDTEGKPYIGESTKREIQWAKLLGKTIYYGSDDVPILVTWEA